MGFEVRTSGGRTGGLKTSLMFLKKVLNHGLSSESGGRRCARCSSGFSGCSITSLPSGVILHVGKTSAAGQRFQILEFCCACGPAEILTYSPGSALAELCVLESKKHRCFFP